MKMHLIKTNDDTLYQVLHQEPETKQLDLEMMKKKYLCGTVFRKDGLYWFVRKIKEAQVIEENLENE
jgi:hypothetical protein